MRLATLQHLISDYILFKQEGSKLSDIIQGGNLSHLQRLNIYRNNTLISLQECLRGTYNVTSQIVGQEFFNQIAKNYIMRDPPREGCLLFYGKGFPFFLSKQPELGNLPYIADLAHFEWKMQSAFHAVDYPILTSEYLSSIEPSKLGKTIFKFHPAFHTMQSSYNIDELWQVHETKKINSLDHFKIIKNRIKNSLVIYRKDCQVYFENIKPAQFSFVVSLKDGNNLIKSFEKAQSKNKKFDLVQAIQALIRWQSIMGYKIKGEKNEQCVTKTT